MLGGEELLRPFDGDVLHDVGGPASAVVAFSRITLRVFVGEDGAHRGEHRARNVILGRDQFERVVLTLDLEIDCVGDLGIDFCKRPLQKIVSRCCLLLKDCHLAILLIADLTR